MITLEMEENEVYQEGVIDSAIKATGIDADKIDKRWNDDKDDKLDIIDKEVVQKIGDTADKLDNIRKKNQVNSSSIVARAKNSIMQFPIYITDSIRINEAQIIAKTFERVYATLVQAVLSQNQVINEDELNDMKFLKNFHTNLRECTDRFINEYYRPIDEFDRMMVESIACTYQVTDDIFVEFRVVPTINEDLIQEDARMSNPPLSGFKYLTEAVPGRDRMVHNKETITNKEDISNKEDVSNKEVQKKGADRAERIVHNTELERLGKDYQRAYNKKVDEHNAQHPNDQKRKKDYMAGGRFNFYQFASDIEDGAKITDKDGNILGYRTVEIRDKDGKLVDSRDEFFFPTRGGDITKDTTGGKSTSSMRTTSSSRTISTTPEALKAPILLKDADIKKINSMLPWTIEAMFWVKNRNGGGGRDVRFIIGVKSILHLIKPDLLTNDLRDIMNGDLKNIQKVRYTTGEINFKDYYFNLKGIKSDAMKHINSSKRWLNTLKRLAEYSKTHGSLLRKGVEALTGGHVPIPNGTLIISDINVTKIRNDTGIDLENVDNAKRLAKSLFLICIVIVNSTRGRMNVLFTDSDNDWDIQSLSSIDAELAKTDNSQLMKELNRMVNR